MLYSQSESGVVNMAWIRQLKKKKKVDTHCFFQAHLSIGLFCCIRNFGYFLIVSSSFLTEWNTAYVVL